MGSNWNLCIHTLEWQGKHRNSTFSSDMLESYLTKKLSTNKITLKLCLVLTANQIFMDSNEKLQRQVTTHELESIRKY